MKIVQVGILVALIAVGALLFVVWRGQQPQPVATETPAAPAVQPEPVTPAPAEAPPPAEAARPSPAPKSKAATKPVETARAPVVEAPPASPLAQQVSPPEPPPPIAAQTAVSEPAPPPAAPAPPPPPARRAVTLAAGTLISVRLAETLSSEKVKAGDSFTATLDKPLVVDGLEIAERGARAEGRVLESVEAGRLKGVSSLAVHLIRFRTADGQTVQILTEPFRKQGETTRAEDAKKVGIGAGIGAAIGAIAGGGKGAAIGAGVGGAAGAGTVAATRGEAAVLPVETRIDFRLSSPVTITESGR